MASRDLTAFGYRRIVILIVALLIVPTVLLLSMGVVLLFLRRVEFNILMGILVVAFSGAATTGIILVWVFVRREANLSQLQSDFVSKVSHELRTPLTSIRLFTETLELRRGDKTAEDKCIAGLSSEGARLQELIDRLLDWGRMESGRRQYIMETTDVREIVEKAVRAFHPEGKRPSSTLSVNVPEELPPLEADKAALGDALLNLLTNAHKYGGDPPEITIDAAASEGEIRISVKDNGAGIPRSEQKRIFYKFYRVDDRLAREREGSGLGLAIVKHVLKAHRGHVDVSSEPGSGSKFTLVLPASGGGS